jgi:tetratricopeptide (TPR) repeat protein
MACLIVILFFSGCAVKRQSLPPPEEETGIAGGAAGALFAEAEDARQSGKFDTAEIQLERALRIEPQNPHFWYTMALVKFQQGQYRQTVQFCLKTESLAARKPQLLSDVKQLKEQAEKAMTQQ